LFPHRHLNLASIIATSLSLFVLDVIEFLHDGVEDVAAMAVFVSDLK